MSPTAQVSIVIPNFNYREYLPASIESALGQTLPCEVVVVDDGSTDGSGEVIAAYQARGVRAIFQEHGGQTVAVSRGFSESTGSIVIFLDADDMLDPKAAFEVCRRWYDGLAKAQFRLEMIDEAGRPLGYRFPGYRSNPTPGRLRDQVLRTGHYPWPPSSGNAYARRFLQKVMPLPAERFPNAPDGLLNTIAPLYGDVLTIDMALGQYRIHDRSQQHSNSLVDRLGRNLGLMRSETAFLYEHAIRLGVPLPSDCLDQLPLLELRMAMVLIGPAYRWQQDSRWSLLRLMLTTSRGRTARAWGQMIWMVAAAVVPPPMRPAVVRLRFEPHTRKPWIARLLRLLRIAP